MFQTNCDLGSLLFLGSLGLGALVGTILALGGVGALVYVLRNFRPNLVPKVKVDNDTDSKGNSGCANILIGILLVVFLAFFVFALFTMSRMSS